MTGRDLKQLERNSSVCERPCEARVGELALRPSSDWIEFTALLGLIKWMKAAVLWSTWPPQAPSGLPRSHDTVPFCSTCWSDLGQQMFQLHSVPKSMTIDFGV